MAPKSVGKRRAAVDLEPFIESMEGVDRDTNKYNTAVDFLANQFSLAISKKSSSIDLWSEFRSSQARFLVRNAHQRYRDALAYAYAVYEIVVNSGDLLEFHLREIYKNQKPGRPEDLLLAVLRTVIVYGKGWHGDVSRDAQAIRHLESQGYGPHEVEEYYRKYRGGVDRWSREYAQTLKQGSVNTAEKENASKTPATARLKQSHHCRVRYVPRKRGARIDHDTETLVIEEEIKKNELWTYVLTRDDDGLKVLDWRYLGPHSKANGSDALQQWFSISERFFRAPRNS